MTIKYSFDEVATSLYADSEADICHMLQVIKENVTIVAITLVGTV